MSAHRHEIKSRPDTHAEPSVRSAQIARPAGEQSISWDLYEQIRRVVRELQRDAE